MNVQALTLGSPAFADGDTLPVRFVRQEAGGQNISPPLTWGETPSGTLSLALAVIDLHPVARHFAHWLVCDLPPDTRELAEGASGRAMPADARELTSGFGTPGWSGPRPPAGSGDHEYRFTLWFLDVDRLGVDSDVAPEEFEAEARTHELASASLSAFFGR